MNEPTQPSNPAMPVILLDLNYTLAENSAQVLQRGHKYNVAAEHYRPWLRDLIAHHYVILITVRPDQYREQTLQRIWDELRWQPNEAYFNQWGFKAPKCKDLIINKYVFPKHGQPADTWYLAVESNNDTAAMYAAHGIERHRAKDVQNAPRVLVTRGPAIETPRLF